jgi:hypothetical protein
LPTVTTDATGGRGDERERAQRFFQLSARFVVCSGLFSFAVAVANLFAHLMPWWFSAILFVGAALSGRAAYLLRRIRSRLLAAEPLATSPVSNADAAARWRQWRTRWIGMMLAFGGIFVVGSVLVGWASGDTDAGAFVAVMIAVIFLLVSPLVYLFIRRYARPR